MHRSLKLPKGDMLIHAGDITSFEMEDELEDFIDWFAKQPFKYKIFISGNHDICLKTSNPSKLLKRGRIATPDSNLFYLCNSSVTIEDIKFLGSPVTPNYLGMAFNKKRGEEIKKIWNKTPNDIDVLITHSPPFGILYNGVGCE